MYVASRIGGHDDGLVDVDAVENGETENGAELLLKFQMTNSLLTVSPFACHFSLYILLGAEADHHFACKRGLLKRPFKVGVQELLKGVQLYTFLAV